ncbi:1,2-dihydroxy-3-keto-5-methylthiopentene dioxygenase-like [Varroa jacobsoni]|uniref:1,2-dihydroxy-3-keto-5-methylthiopentene dioxygenase-like n=1 Tax=Varroa jacobsoni TaxID=62625 RepID=UPI000BF905CC|nr:1,2-dihydroxy-3-keto-5-methylthiopentene dioxygenase-like [Varroa jacobsoni]XP_022685868.1 1,2-dihydroxy-3-keto-5-methylthiopentene dioxygenase-like [Varroa jacobsoni]
MVRCYYMDSSNEDKRLPHELNPPQNVDLETLYKKTGVLYFKIDESDWSGPEAMGKLKEIREKRGYTYQDVCAISKESLGEAYDDKINMFYKEHLHTDEEIRLIEEGSGYFDVRDSSDRWIRIRVEKGDMLIVPAGIYHRFTVDTSNQIRARRFFVGEPVWTPINRPADEQEARKTYLNNLEEKFSVGIGFA